MVGPLFMDKLFPVTVVATEQLEPNSADSVTDNLKPILISLEVEVV